MLNKAGNRSFRESREAQTKGLKQNNDLTQLRLENKRRELERYIHNEASEYLSKGKPKRDIGSLIWGLGIKGVDDKILSRKSIARYLANHPSGLWKPRKRTSQK